tara:strand:- start:937 stop:1560 length:624 start_codon:yes stop_codon:yes gene_type:complete
MTKELLQEYFELCPEGRCPIDRLTESEKRNVTNGGVYLVGICQKAGTKNGNGRIYRKETLQREVQNYQRAITERRSLGELDHPDDSVINLKNASHLCTKMWWDGDQVMAKFEVLDTPSGRILKDLVKAGIKLGISSRGLGSTKQEKGNTIVEDDFQLICFDMVSEPSTPGAFLSHQKDAHVAPEINMYLKESKKKEVDSLIDSILKD